MAGGGGKRRERRWTSAFGAANGKYANAICGKQQAVQRPTAAMRSGRSKRIRRAALEPDTAQKRAKQTGDTAEQNNAMRRTGRIKASEQAEQQTCGAVADGYRGGRQQCVSAARCIPRAGEHGGGDGGGGNGGAECGRNAIIARQRGAAGGATANVPGARKRRRWQRQMQYVFMRRRDDGGKCGRCVTTRRQRRTAAMRVAAKRATLQRCCGGVRRRRWRDMGAQ